MVVVVIMAILSVAVGLQVHSRLRISRLENALQTVTADFAYLRTAGILKGCPTRLIFCSTRTCNAENNQAPAAITQDATTGRINSVGDPVRYYAVLRMSQNPATPNAVCPNTNFVATDGYADWDYDTLGTALSSGIGFSAIYDRNNGVPDQTNWTDSTTNNALNSIWFNTTTSQLNLPIDTSPTIQVNGQTMTVVAQIAFDDCNPANDPACPAYIIWMDAGGAFGYSKCLAGSQGLGCF